MQGNSRRPHHDRRPPCPRGRIRPGVDHVEQVPARLRLPRLAAHARAEDDRLHRRKGVRRGQARPGVVDRRVEDGDRLAAVGVVGHVGGREADVGAAGPGGFAVAGCGAGFVGEAFHGSSGRGDSFSLGVEGGKGGGEKVLRGVQLSEHVSRRISFKVHLNRKEEFWGHTYTKPMEPYS